MDGEPRVRLAALNERVRSAVRDRMEEGRPTEAAEAAWRAIAPAPPGSDERLHALASRLGLAPLPATVLALAAFAQLDPGYRRVFAYLQDGPDRPLPTPRLLARLLDRGEDVLACLLPDAPLRRLGCLDLIDPGPGVSPLDAPVAVAPEVGAFLLGVPPGVDDPRWRRVPVPQWPLGRADAVDRLRRYLAQPGEVPVLVRGPDAQLVLAVALGRPLLVTSLRDLHDGPLQRRARLVSALDGCAHAHEGLETLERAEHDRVSAALATAGERALLCVDRPGPRPVLALTVEVPPPALDERRTAWRALSGSGDCDDVAAAFRLSIGQIARAAEIARSDAAAEGRSLPGPEHLASSARAASATRLGELAARLDPVPSWDSLVLPPRQISLLRSISTYLRQRERVLDEWGYGREVARNQGVKAMFAGESGTGKTMGAQVIARDLGLDIFRVDLATIVSKYVGETEKNLDRIFTAAEGSNAILFFDEADALFGKRSEVSDSHDRYANIEVAYLLQKMESYAGAVMLATNYKQNVDDAFLRRLDFVVVFPFPEAPARRRIWELVLPAEAPLAPDVDLDFLARQFRLSGGGIRNCSLSAAFQAADAGGPIAMEHLVRAVAVEYDKLGRLTVEADFGRFLELVRVREPSA